MSAAMEGTTTATNHLPPQTSTTDIIVGEFSSESPGKPSAETSQEQSEQEEIIQTCSPTSIDQPSTLSPPPLPPRPAKSHIAFASTPTAASYRLKSGEEMPRKWNPFSCRFPNFNEDFDLSNRTKTYKATRFTGMQRKTSALLRRISSTPAMEAAEANAETSAGNDTNTNTNTTGASAPLLPQTPLSALPSDRANLEGLINIHLSKLDRLRRQITALNTDLRTLISQLRDLRLSSEARAVPQLLALQQMEIFQVRMIRDSKKVFVDFHRGELALIAEKRGELDREAGLTPRLPLVYEGLEGDEVWARRFW